MYKISLKQLYIGICSLTILLLSFFIFPNDLKADNNITGKFIKVTATEIGSTDRAKIYALNVTNGILPSFCESPEQGDYPGYPKLLYKLVPSADITIKSLDKNPLFVADNGDGPWNDLIWTQANNHKVAYDQNTVNFTVLDKGGSVFVQIYCWNTLGFNEYINILDNAVDINENIESTVSADNSFEFSILGVNTVDVDKDNLDDAKENPGMLCPSVLSPDSDSDGLQDGNDQEPCLNPKYSASPLKMFDNLQTCKEEVGDRANDKPPVVCYPIKGLEGRTYYRYGTENVTAGGTLWTGPQGVDTSGWNVDLSEVRTLIGTYYNLAISFGVLAAIIMIIIGGYQYATATGNQERLSQAKNTITQALLGLAVLILTAVFLNLVNPAIIGG